jgi:hypothetical protein
MKDNYRLKINKSKKEFISERGRNISLAKVVELLNESVEIRDAYRESFVKMTQECDGKIKAVQKDRDEVENTLNTILEQCEVDRKKDKDHIQELKERLMNSCHDIGGLRKEIRRLEEEIKKSKIDSGVEASFDWSLSVECPECKKDIDLADGDHDIDSCFSGPLFGNDWDKINGEEVTCDNPDCECEFVIKEVVY